MNKTPERQNSRSSSKPPPDIKTIRDDKRKQRMRRDGSGISLSSMNSPIRRRLFNTSMNNTSPFSSPKRVSSVSKSQTPSPFSSPMRVQNTSSRRTSFNNRNKVSDVKARKRGTGVSAYHDWNGGLKKNIKKEDFIDILTLENPKVKIKNGKITLDPPLWIIQSDTVKQMYSMPALEKWAKHSHGNFKNTDYADQVHFMHPTKWQYIKFSELYPVNSTLVLAYKRLLDQ